MTFPTGTTISTSNLDSPSKNPSLARADLYSLVVAFNQLVASANIANGVLVLNASSQVPSANLPSNYTIDGSLTLNPASAITNMSNVLRLQQLAVADLGVTVGTTSAVAGDVTYLTDGDAGSACLAVYDGSNWRVVRLMTTVGDVGATVSAAFALTCSADIV